MKFRFEFWNVDQISSNGPGEKYLYLLPSICCIGDLRRKRLIVQWLKWGGFFMWENKSKVRNWDKELVKTMKGD